MRQFSGHHRRYIPTDQAFHHVKCVLYLYNHLLFPQMYIIVIIVFPTVMQHFLFVCLTFAMSCLLLYHKPLIVVSWMSTDLWSPSWEKVLRDLTHSLHPGCFCFSVLEWEGQVFSSLSVLSWRGWDMRVWWICSRRLRLCAHKGLPWCRQRYAPSAHNNNVTCL